MKIFTPRQWARCAEPACSDQPRYQCEACGKVSCERHSNYCANCARLRLRFNLLAGDYWKQKRQAEGDQVAVCIIGEL